MIPNSFARKTFLLVLISIVISSNQFLLQVKADNTNDLEYTILQIVVGFIAVSVVISLIVYIILSFKKKIS